MYLVSRLFKESPSNIVANILNCDIIVSKFDLQLH